MGIKVEGVAPLIEVFDMPRSIAMKQPRLTDPDGYGICLQARVIP